MPARPDSPAALRLKALLRALWPGKLLRAVFVDQVRLRRKGSQLVFALSALDTRSAKGEDAPAVPPPSPPPAAAETRGLHMSRALGQLLDSRADSRKVLKHLAVLERQLRKRPEPFLHEVSPDNLRRMIRQLDGLIVPPASPGVALLKGEMLKALELKPSPVPLVSPEVPEVSHEPDLPDVPDLADLSSALSSAYAEAKIEVTELGPLEFQLVDVEGAPPPTSPPPPSPPTPSPSAKARP